MTLTQARKLRDHIRKHGAKAVVPLGVGRGKDGYYVVVKFSHEPDKIVFQNPEQFRLYAHAQRQRIIDFCRANGIGLVRDQRSPLERMIDEACGV